MQKVNRMSEVQSPAAETAGLTQWQRIGDTFIAPAKTFEDIKRGNRSWWLPFLLFAIAGYALFGVISSRIGMDKVIENQINMNPKYQERIAEASPEQQARIRQIQLYSIEVSFLSAPLLMLAGFALLSLGLLGTINFVFAGRATYAEVFAMWFYASLPQLVKTIMGMIVICFQAPEQFNVQNFSPTNAAALLLDPSSNQALYALASSVDITTIWTLVLLSMGIATVARVKRSSGYIAVFGWWVVFVLLRVGWTAAFS